jgi:phage shock protein PspC (stress-responsive transcriptional regulator)
MQKLYRSTRDRKIFGVCGGLADYLNVDATLLRILLVIVAVFSAGSIILVYIIAGFVIPREDQVSYGPGPGPANWGWPPGPGTGPGQQHYHPPQYGNQSWPPNTNWPGAGTTTTPPPQNFSRPAPAADPIGQRSQGLDAMMEDIEKKALRKELEELKAKLSKLEKESKGE